MTKEEYQDQIKAFFLLAAVAANYLPEAKQILEAMNRSETLGPMLDPTAWIHNSQKMDEDKALVEAIIAFGSKFEQLKAKAKK